MQTTSVLSIFTVARDFSATPLAQLRDPFARVTASCRGLFERLGLDRLPRVTSVSLSAKRIVTFGPPILSEALRLKVGRRGQ